MMFGKNGGILVALAACIESYSNEWRSFASLEPMGLLKYECSRKVWRADANLQCARPAKVNVVGTFPVPNNQPKCWSVPATLCRLAGEASNPCVPGIAARLTNCLSVVLAIWNASKQRSKMLGFSPIQTCFVILSCKSIMH